MNRFLISFYSSTLDLFDMISSAKLIDLWRAWNRDFQWQIAAWILGIFFKLLLAASDWANWVGLNRRPLDPAKFVSSNALSHDCHSATIFDAFCKKLINMAAFRFWTLDVKWHAWLRRNVGGWWREFWSTHFAIVVPFLLCPKPRQPTDYVLTRDHFKKGRRKLIRFLLTIERGRAIHSLFAPIYCY